MFVYIQQKYSSEEFGIKYILTKRLNQDILENFVSYIKLMGNPYDHSVETEVKTVYFGEILKTLSQHRNAEGDTTSEMLEMEDVHNFV